MLLYSRVHSRGRPSSVVTRRPTASTFPDTVVTRPLRLVTRPLTVVTRPSTVLNLCSECPGGRLDFLLRQGFD